MHTGGEGKNDTEIKNAGTSIDKSAVKYHDLISALKAALDEKYSKVSAAAKRYGDTDEYLNNKYFNKYSAIYERDLSEEERMAGYRNEKSYLNTGHVRGVNFSDSLFRGMEFNSDVMDHDRLQWERRVINTQIDNILRDTGIDPNEIQDNCIISVDPYSKYISVSGIEDTIKDMIEEGMNVGTNGKNLFLHLYKLSTQDNCNSIQISEEANTKYQAFARINELTGLKLNDLIQKNGSFYTDEGKDVLEIADQSIEKTVPSDYRDQMQNWVRDLLSKVANKGWNNMSDLILKVQYGKNGLKDMDQDMIFDGYSKLDNAWYSIL
ncbi:DUF4885 family protein [Lachnospira multipara]|uniref:DUF4885 family protein n=1 Tax=Lachnospira multipara TaxID=28051 RepID=UPI0009DDA9A1|nr:DUF4885 family protein [Lachnospira multipara]